MRGSATPTCSPTHAPNENPISPSARPGYLPSRKSIAARTSSFSPSPWSKEPLEAPTPRKLKRSAAHPALSADFPARNTTRLSIVPPWEGCGWQRTAAPRKRCSSGSRSTASSSTDRPAIRSGMPADFTRSADLTGTKTPFLPTFPD